MEQKSFHRKLTTILSDAIESAMLTAICTISDF